MEREHTTVATRHGDLHIISGGIARSGGAGGLPPLVLLHGNTMTAESQQRLAQRFEDCHHVVSVDLPGHGQSARPPQLFSPRYFAILGEAVADMLVAHFAATPVVLFGMSAGAIAAVNAACAQPQAVAALVLDSLFHTVGPATLAAHRRTARMRSVAWERYLRAQHGDDWWPVLLTGVLHVIETLAEQGGSVLACLDTIGCPALVLQGGRDLFCPTEQGRAIAEQLPQGRLLYDSGAGHILAWHNPAAFRELVRGFVQSLALAPAQDAARTAESGTDGMVIPWLP